MTNLDHRPRTEPRPQTATRAANGVVLAVLLMAIFMGQFDFFVVNVAAPSLRGDLGATDGALQLIVGGYAFAYASGLVSGGRLGDMFGYRTMFAGGMLGFSAASLLCGVATGPAQLAVFRLLQGATAAVMLPQVLASVKAMFPASYQPRAMAWYGVTAGLGAVAGQALGGLLVSADVAGLGWRSIFLVNVPIGLVVAALAWRILPARVGRSDEQQPVAARLRQLDPLGAAGIAASLALVLVPLTLGRAMGWPAWAWGCLAAAVPAGAATLRWERAAGRRGLTPMLDLPLLRGPGFRAGVLANVAFMLYFGSYMFTLSLLLQAGLGLSALAAGLVFTPAALAFAAAALVARRLIERAGLRVIVGGAVLTAAGLAALGWRLADAGLHAGLPAIVAATTVISLGNGFVLPSLIGVALADVPGRKAGVASGMLTAGQQFASSTGVALIGAVFFAVAASRTGHAGYPVAMAWSAAVDAALILLVAAMIPIIGRSSRRNRAS
ncbi:MAG TPA: MFS transporter [Jatrophihabitans sp.]|nr:MFS transporter [Jatrophihabitans sp.]